MDCRSFWIKNGSDYSDVTVISAVHSNWFPLSDCIVFLSGHRAKQLRVIAALNLYTTTLLHNKLYNEHNSKKCYVVVLQKCGQLLVLVLWVAAKCTPPLCARSQIPELEVCGTGRSADGVLMSVGDVYSLRTTIRSRNPVCNVSGIPDL